MTRHGDGAPPEWFDALDRALLDLRRFWAAPERIPDRVGVADDAAAPPDVELSTLLVVEAVRARTAAHRRGDAPDGHARDGHAPDVGVRDVADDLDVTPSTASRLVDRAVRAGVVVKGPGVTDRRSTNLALTPDGERLAERARAFRAARLTGLLGGWPADDAATLARLLGRLATAVRAEGAGARG
ncbi:MarR family winged helix-turn-helix transcriptional regulator [Actinotalea sp. AC32]|nr:MarR family winged helix-turn-helix transcriptional regulator [Actinotalea sp. AC32]